MFLPSIISSSRRRQLKLCDTAEQNGPTSVPSGCNRQSPVAVILSSVPAFGTCTTSLNMAFSLNIDKSAHSNRGLSSKTKPTACNSRPPTDRTESCARWPSMGPPLNTESSNMSKFNSFNARKR